MKIRNEFAKQVMIPGITHAKNPHSPEEVAHVRQTLSNFGENANSITAPSPDPTSQL